MNALNKYLGNLQYVAHRIFAFPAFKDQRQRSRGLPVSVPFKSPPRFVIPTLRAEPEPAQHQHQHQRNSNESRMSKT